MKTIDLRKDLLNAPLLLSEKAAQAFRAFAPESFFIEPQSADTQQAEQVMFNFDMGGETRSKPYRMEGSAAVIPITGVLIHRMKWGFSGATGYDYVRSMFDHALADPDVKGIVFDVNSPGGMVDGAFDLADHIYANRSVKPSMSIVDAHAYSAGYLLGSAAGRMSVPKTGGVGSIGVVVMHADMSKMLDDAGVKITFIHAGARKVEGNPYEALSDDVKGRIQASVDQSYDMFVGSIVNHRGMSDEAVRGTEAGTFGADEALSLNLVDAVESPQMALSAFVAELSGVNTEEQHMTVKKDADQSATNEKVLTQADLDAAHTAGAKAERERSAAVMSNENYKGREALANHLMDTTDMSAEAISATIAMQPVVAAPKVREDKSEKANDKGFAAAMEKTGNPEVGADTTTEAKEENVSDRMLRNYQAQTGAKLVGIK